jgi:catechol 2,3-dioxygenase-like lactoylglutathione lyase family enzyme
MSQSLRSVGVITLFVADAKRSKAFYESVFDIKSIFEDENSAVVKFDNLLLNILVRSQAPELIEPAPVAEAGVGAGFMFTIWVDDADATCEELRGRGVDFLNGPVDRPWGVRTAAFADPDGHAWEIAQQLG